MFLGIHDDIFERVPYSCGILMSAPVMEKVGKANFEAFFRLIVQLAEYEQLTPPDKSAKQRLESDALGDNPRYEAYLAIVDNKAVGYVTIYFTYSTFLARPTLYIEDIFVSEECRHRGIGGRMLSFCRTLAQEHDCGRVEWMVLDWNEPAIRFYEKSGAQRLEWYVYRLNRDQI